MVKTLCRTKIGRTERKSFPDEIKEEEEKKLDFYSCNDMFLCLKVNLAETRDFVQILQIALTFLLSLPQIGYVDLVYI